MPQGSVLGSVISFALSVSIYFFKLVLLFFFPKEMDACLVDNGGCDKNALCMKVGPNRVCLTFFLVHA